MDQMMFVTYLRVPARSEFQNFEVEVLRQEHYSRYWTRHGLVFKWQAGRNSHTWYGGDLTLEGADTEKLHLAGRILHRLERAEVRIYDDPMGVVGVLRKMRMVEGVYDPRVDGYLLLPEVAPPEFRGYMAWAAGPTPYRNLSQVLARSPEEARPLLVAEVARRLGVAGDQRDHYVQWLADPESEVRVKESAFGCNQAPDARTAEEKLAPAPVVTCG